MKRSSRILVGLFAPVVAAVLFVVGEFFLDAGDLLMDPGADPGAFGRMVAGGGFAFYAARGLVGAFLETLGAVALYLYLEDNRAERAAFWGMVLSVLGDFAGAVFFGSMLVLYPDLGPLVAGGDPALVEALTLSPALLAVMGIPTLLGLVFIAVAVWRSGVLPKWAGVLMLVGFLVLPVQLFVLQLLGNVLWGLGALWIFVGAWRRLRTPPPEPGAPPARP